MFKLLVINLIAVVYCMSDIDRPIRKKIGDSLYKGIPFREDFLVQPLKCPGCMGTWAGLISLIWIGITWKNIALALVIAYCNSVMEDLLRLLKDIMNKMIDIIYLVLEGKK